jgi:hypothetical protein
VTRLYAAEYEAHCEKLESGALEVLDGLWLGNVSARRGDLIRVGVRSDRFSVRWHADTDLGLRLREAGCRGVFDLRCQATHLHAQSAASFLRSAHERGEGTWLLRADHAERFSAVRPAPVFDGLSSPVRGLVSFLGREGRSGWSSRLLMSVAEGVERLGWNTVSARAAQLARRIQIACGFRCAERSGRSRPPANEARPADHDPWSTKSAR